MASPAVWTSFDPSPYFHENEIEDCVRFSTSNDTSEDEHQDLNSKEDYQTMNGGQHSSSAPSTPGTKRSGKSVATATTASTSASRSLEDREHFNLMDELEGVRRSLESVDVHEDEAEECKEEDDDGSKALIEQALSMDDLFLNPSKTVDSHDSPAYDGQQVAPTHVRKESNASTWSWLDKKKYPLRRRDPGNEDRLALEMGDLALGQANDEEEVTFHVEQEDQVDDDDDEVCDEGQEADQNQDLSRGEKEGVLEECKEEENENSVVGSLPSTLLKQPFRLPEPRRYRRRLDGHNIKRQPQPVEYIEEDDHETFDLEGFRDLACISMDKASSVWHEFQKLFHPPTDEIEEERIRSSIARVSMPRPRPPILSLSIHHTYKAQPLRRVSSRRTTDRSATGSGVPGIDKCLADSLTFAGTSIMDDFDEHDESIYNDGECVFVREDDISTITDPAYVLPTPKPVKPQFQLGVTPTSRRQRAERESKAAAMKMASAVSTPAGSWGVPKNERQREAGFMEEEKEEYSGGGEDVGITFRTVLSRSLFPDLRSSTLSPTPSSSPPSSPVQRSPFSPSRILKGVTRMNRKSTKTTLSPKQRGIQEMDSFSC